jgi:mRNA-degrading endonuclease HigB of HigAB toxin-antitoxin module
MRLLPLIFVCFLFMFLEQSCKSVKKTINPQTLNFVSDFDGKNNGIADNYQAFLSLAKYLNNNSHVTIIFPEGVYLINKYKESPCISNDAVKCNKQTQGNGITDITYLNCNNINFIGQGAKIKVLGKYVRKFDFKYSSLNFKYSNTSSVIPFCFVNCQNILVDGFELDGDTQNTLKEKEVTEGLGSGIFVSDLNNLDYKPSADFLFRNLKIHNFIGDAMTLAPKGKGFVVENCIINNNGRQGISITRGSDYKISNCSITKTGDTGKYGNHSPSAGIDIENEYPEFVGNILINNSIIGDNEGFQIVGTNSSNITIDSCYIYDKALGYESPLLSGIGLYTDYTKVSNSVIYAAFQIDLGAYDAKNIKQGITIENNYIASGSQVSCVLSSDFNFPMVFKDNIVVRLPLKTPFNGDSYFPLIRNKNALVSNNIWVNKVGGNSQRVISIIENMSSYDNNIWINNINSENENNQLYFLPAISSKKDKMLNYFTGKTLSSDNRSLASSRSSMLPIMNVKDSINVNKLNTKSNIIEQLKASNKISFIN